MKRLLNLKFLSRIKLKMPFYAVAKGKIVGIYTNWPDCENQIKGFSGAKYKKFPTLKEAESFVKANAVGIGTSSTVTSGSSLIRPSSTTTVVENNTVFDIVPIGRKSRPVCRPSSSTTASSQSGSVQEEIPFVDFWPDELSNDADDNWMVRLASKIEPIAGELERKRKTSPPSEFREILKKMRRDSFVYKSFGKQMFGGFEFPVDSDGFVLMYTDGSCEGNGQANAIAGLGVWISENHPLNISKPVSGRATNNCGEIQAASEAIRIANRCNIKKLCISTDSMFVINSVTKWMNAWKRKGWKLGNGSPVRNVVDFKELDKLIGDKTLKIRWNYVKGHAGIKGNEGADKLARIGSLMYKAQQKK